MELAFALLFIIPIIMFLALAYFTASTQIQLASPQKTPASPKLAPRGDGLPSIPRTAQEVLTTMDDKEFEWFSAAIVMGTRDGYRFYRHCGGSGDQGIDAKLWNPWKVLVGVQSKFYIPSNTVSSEEMRNFLGSLVNQQIAYGYFVTTSTFTRDAQQVVDGASGRIRAIDGQNIDAYLRWQSREISLAWREILAWREAQKKGAA